MLFHILFLTKLLEEASLLDEKGFARSALPLAFIPEVVGHSTNYGHTSYLFDDIETEPAIMQPRIIDKVFGSDFVIVGMIAKTSTA